MDYGKIADILSVIWVDAVPLDTAQYLPSDFWVEFEDELQLATYVTAEWVELTQEGKFRLQDAWEALCQVRGLDPEVMYDDIKAFFEAQAVDAELVPMEKGKKK